jgi:hypothetical protein
MSQRTTDDNRVPFATSARGGVGLRAAAVAVSTVLGAVAFTAFLVWHAPYERDEVVPYNTMLDIREGWWASHYLGGAAMGLGLVALALAACLLVRRGAGSALVTVGAGLCMFGGVGTAVGLASEATAYYYATGRDALAAEPGAGLLKYLSRKATGSSRWGSPDWLRPASGACSSRRACGEPVQWTAGSLWPWWSARSR